MFEWLKNSIFIFRFIESFAQILELLSSPIVYLSRHFISSLLFIADISLLLIVTFAEVIAA